MRRNAMAALPIVVALAAFVPGCSTADAQRDEARPANELLGTWKQVSGKFNGQDFQPPEGTTLIKHVTPAGFMFVDVDKDGQIRDAAGGSYTVIGDTYFETPTYATGDFHGLKGKTQRFTWRVEGNRWFHSGTLTSGLTIEEVWERVDPQ